MFERIRGWHPALLALLVQVAATGVTVAVAYWLAVVLDARMPPFALALVQGGLAAFLAYGLRMARWWLLISLLFVPGLLWVQGYAMPAELFFILFVLLLLVNWNSLRERVPLYLTGRKTAEQLALLLAERPQPLRYIDLGSGLAGSLKQLARRFPDSHFDGVETAPLVFLLSWLRCSLQGNCRIRYRSLWQVDLAGYDVVYCFLSPAPMPALWAKVAQQLSPGSCLISNTFAVPDVPPSRRIEMGDWRQSSLLLWQL